MQKELFESIRNGIVDFVASTSDAQGVYLNSPAWTKAIKKICEKAVFELNFKGWNKENMTLKHDYLKVDSLVSENLRKDPTLTKNGAYQSKVDGVDFWLYQRKPRVVIEYENERKSLTDMADRLSHIRSDLKVIIAYSTDHGNMLDYEGLAGAKMSMVHWMVKSCEPEALKDNWLVIILPSKTLDPKQMLGFTMDSRGYHKI